MKKDWFYETAYPETTIGLKIKEKLYTGKSKFQKIEFMDTDSFGRMLVLDGVVQATVRDEFIYHEMIAHVPLCAHPDPRQVLIIGGGDGGVVREVIKHPNIAKVTLVEIDSKVIELCKKYLPETAQALDDPKVEVRCEDGAKFIADKTAVYDVVIVDSSDPVGPSTVLFAEEFYRCLSNSLKKDGMLIRQSGSSFLLQEPLKQVYQTIHKVFQYTTLYTAAIPTYIGGFFTFVYASQSIAPTRFDSSLIAERYARMSGKTGYYNPAMHQASFALPNYLEELMPR
jgi:spermidine synthase